MSYCDLLGHYRASFQTRYIQKIPIRMAQSTRKIIITVMGTGLEPKLDFNMGHATFDPILPHSLGDEKEVVVSNPCPFSVEMYSLEFDKQYLQEEEVCWLLIFYCFNTLIHSFDNLRI